MERLDKKLIVFDLFAGAGGFGLGFEQAGFEVPLSLEMDSWACDTLRQNHHEMTIIQTDIRNFANPQVIKAVSKIRPDIIIGGPPCQGFSIAGPAQKDIKDPRNSLFKDFAGWIKVLEPKSFVMENVKGLLSRKNSDGENIVEIMKRTFADLGYFVEVWTLNSAEYGVPQMRERIFIVGHLKGFEIGKPPVTHTFSKINSNNSNFAFLDEQDLRPALTLWDAISDLPALFAGKGEEEQTYNSDPETVYQELLRNSSERLYNHVAMQHSKRLVERFKHIKWGESSSDVPSEHSARKRNGNGDLSGKIYDQNNRRLHPQKPSHTIAASFYANFVHPYQHRNLTAREGARIQSFPDSYKFMGKKTVVSHKLLQREGRFEEKFLCQYNQIGNAVPPLLAKAVANHLKEKLDL